MRGEHGSCTRSVNPEGGSSPHARGARGDSVHGDVVVRIIPACAGSTCLSSFLAAYHPDHPRMRGEHERPEQHRAHQAGSSPHARGARERLGRAVVRPRIIPACAGSTRKTRARCGQTKDHPRMRGEHQAAHYGLFPRGGSSPHARGAHAQPLRILLRQGIIPASAGSTCVHFSPQ